MFTGIITNRAVVKKKEKKGGQVRFEFAFEREDKRPLELGESIAVNGVCLTVTAKSGKNFQADAVRETLQVTTLGRLEPGDSVNTERALRYGDSMGGHLVSGHVDGTGTVKKIEREEKNTAYWIEVPASLKKFLVPKGSITVDGISLTVQEIRGRQFKTAIVPHTLKLTTLSNRKTGDRVNLETERDGYLRGSCRETARGCSTRVSAPTGALFPATASKKSRITVKALKKQGF